MFAYPQLHESRLFAETELTSTSICVAYTTCGGIQSEIRETHTDSPASCGNGHTLVENLAKFKIVLEPSSLRPGQ